MKILTQSVLSALVLSVLLASIGTHAQTVLVPLAGQVKTLPDGYQTKAQILALRVSHFAITATPKAGGGYTMTGVCDGDHKIKIQGRKNGSTGLNVQGQPAVMFEFELICNKPDPTNPPIFSPVAGKTNVFNFDTNIRLLAVPTAGSPGLAPGVWTVNATQKGGVTAPMQDVILPPYTVTF